MKARDVLRLTLEQLQRLFGVERTVCQQAVDSLAKAKFLCVKSEPTPG